MISEFLSKFSSGHHARVIIECIEVLEKHLSPAYFSDESKRQEVIDSVLAYILSIKGLKKDG